MHKSVLRKKLFNITNMPADVIDYIHSERWLQIWVPKNYGGLGLSFSDGLKHLKSFAEINGNFGWMITLCAGANYFSRNLKPQIAKKLFQDKKTCFGGSGFIGGTAELTNNFYLINGRWTFATGAPYLSHFTLNAVVTQNNQPVLDDNGNELIRSFIIPKDQVDIIADWKAMGMQATGTYSFTVNDVLVHEDNSFIYNEFYTDAVLDRIPFRIFADLTLLVNYLGMAEHFLAEAERIKPELDLKSFKYEISEIENQTYIFANNIEKILEEHQKVTADIQEEIHQFGKKTVSNISHKLLDIYIQLGIKASHTDEPIHQIFCDYFTATQHANYR